jgi:prepilin peptidase CpaA
MAALVVARVLLLGVFPFLLILAAIWDLATYTIPNRLTVALAATFPVFALFVGMMPIQIGYHLLTGLCAIVLGFALFALRFVGGGDAKLFAAAALWFGFRHFLIFALTASVIGGAMTLAILAFRKVPLPQILCRHAWIMRLHDERAGIPYGVALASGALVVLPQADILRLSLG